MRVHPGLTVEDPMSGDDAAPPASVALRVAPDDRLVSLLRPTSFEADQYRVLRHTVETMRKDANLHVVAVTSPGVGDGKTTTSINLAGALAQAASARVLLADVDLRRPAVAHQLGLKDSRGGFLELLLQPELTLADVVQCLPRFNVSVLPAGRGAAAPYEALKSPRLEALLDDARQRYDYVVLDAPPFMPVPDCRLIAPRVDGFLVVVAAHRTRRRELAEALDLMDPAKVVGLVFNRDDLPASYYSVYPVSPRRGRPRRSRGGSPVRQTPPADSSRARWDT
jgi:capsular exopolysaccharide synthesis family protein